MKLARLWQAADAGGHHGAEGHTAIHTFLEGCAGKEGEGNG